MGLQRRTRLSFLGASRRSKNALYEGIPQREKQFSEEHLPWIVENSVQLQKFEFWKVPCWGDARAWCGHSFNT